MSLDKLLPKLLKAQSEFPAIPKNGKNPHFRSQYILLDDVLRLCSPVLHKNELLVTQTMSVDSGGNNKLTTTLYHTSGQSLSSEMSLINKAGTDQGLGSSISYAKRYSLIAMLGLSDDDDDAEATKPVEKPKSKIEMTREINKFVDKIHEHNPLIEKPTAKQMEDLKAARVAVKMETDAVINLCRKNWQCDPQELTKAQMNIFISQIKKTKPESKTT